MDGLAVNLSVIYFVITQGPNKTSVADIWRMVWQLDVDKIVMLTNPVENGKVHFKQPPPLVCVY